MPETNIEIVESQDIPIVHQSESIVPFLFSVEEIKKTSCKLCNAECREEAEAFYEKQKKKNYLDIKRWLADQKNIVISYPAVRNHMLYHYRAAQRNLSLSEFSEDLQKWVDFHSNKAAAIRARIGVMTKELLTLSSQAEDMDGDEKRKTVDLIRKLAETITTHEEKLMDYDRQTKPVTLIFNQLKVVFTEEMKNNNSPAVKTAFTTVLKRLQEKLGDIIVE